VKSSDYLLLAAGAAVIYVLWPKAQAKAGTPTISVPYATSATSPGTSGATRRSAPAAVVDTVTSVYEQQASMAPDDLAQSILTQGLNGFEGTAFAGGWWR